MASKQTTFTVYTINPDGQITLVEDPKVIERMKRWTRSLGRQMAGSRSSVTTYLYCREELKRTE